MTCTQVASPNHRPGVTDSSVAGRPASHFHRWGRHRFIWKSSRYPQPRPIESHRLAGGRQAAAIQFRGDLAPPHRRCPGALRRPPGRGRSLGERGASRRSGPLGACRRHLGPAPASEPRTRLHRGVPPLPLLPLGIRRAELRREHPAGPDRSDRSALRVRGAGFVHAVHARTPSSHLALRP